MLKKTTLDEAPALLRIGAMHTLLLWLFLDGASTVELDAGHMIVLSAPPSRLLLSGRVAARWLARPPLRPPSAASWSAPSASVEARHVRS